MIKQEFIPYEQALALKKLGFNEPCLDFFDDTKELFYNHGNKEKIHIGNSVAAPLYQQAFRWFREKYKLKCCIIPLVCEQGYSDLYESRIHQEKHSISIIGNYKIYEEAELECLKKLIKICDKTNN